MYVPAGINVAQRLTSREASTARTAWSQTTVSPLPANHLRTAVVPEGFQAGTADGNGTLGSGMGVVSESCVGKTGDSDVSGS